ncbi:PTB domain-containing engulfment adapter protein 1-like isoform X1 [Portunus trituberculatus]|uniref:PTB domain-containing engulfment adapter protein 1-like isoform X1 n=1 Tax=Portunus trituberculatus TaxID=210409 RepID=UPI001E1CD06B|nr:PTB domain-containing engulfment adapter protein 1-like isoform X1 [Portunus trituberculatus]XP_045123898.1 PTB domain-containing engulfment adapter protein 1-like isoform X1 [Portunus trituberculatus]XP_045123900.1 PTB domain-containing engulfment adapter protein 1-like isoform X1 [Portunus trituberculatus]XP_045123901.1 PTB domain-containing engulfment adapter protein 1-like isoform X1 [Portunus trituberculatus]
MGKLTQRLREKDKDKEATSTGSSTGANKNWLHPPEALQKGHIGYLVKFLGSTEVNQPKGIEVVKEGIRKLKFNQQLKKAEGSKTPKVELTVSIDGVAIHEPKTKRNLHQYPLHRISYCADDKAEKRFFSFIAKEADSDKHTCFVFVSDKLAEEITLTIGQAFDLAYRRFVETSGKEVEMRRQLLILQKRVQGLEDENQTLKTRITQLASLKNRPDVEDYMRENNISDLLTLNGESSTDPEPSSDSPASSTSLNPPPIPPRNTAKGESNLIDILPSSSPVISNGIDNDDDDFNPRAEEPSPPTTNGLNGSTTTAESDEDDFDPRAEEKKPPTFTVGPAPEINGFSSPPPLVPPPRPARPHEQQNGLADDIFDTNNDPFDSVAFSSQGSNNDALAQFIEMKAGFSRGLSFGTADEDFTLESLDPLKN